MIEQQKQQQLLEQQKQHQLMEQLEQQKQQHLLEQQQQQQLLEQQQKQQKLMEQQLLEQQLQIQQQQQLQQQIISSQPQILDQQQLQQQIITSSQSQPLYYQPILEQSNIIYQQQQTSEASYQQQQPQQTIPDNSSNVVYQQQPQTVIEPTSVIQQQQQPNVIYQQPQQIVEQPNVLYQQQQPVLEKPNIVYQQQPVLEQPNVVYQQQQQLVEQAPNVLYQPPQPQSVENPNIIYQQAPQPVEQQPQVIYKPQDVGTQPPTVQYIPVVVPLEQQQVQAASLAPTIQQEPNVPVPSLAPVIQEPVDPLARKILEMQQTMVVQQNNGGQVEAPAVPVPADPGVVPPHIETVQQQVEVATLSPVTGPVYTGASSGGTEQDRDKVSCNVLSHPAACSPKTQPAHLPFIKLDISSARQHHQLLPPQLDDAAAAGGQPGWGPLTAPVIISTDNDGSRFSRDTRRGSLPVNPQPGSLLAPPRLGQQAGQLGSQQLAGGHHMKAHSAESSPKRISSLSMSTYNNIAHKLPFPSQSLRRRSADPSDLLRYSGDGARAGASPTQDDLGLLSLLEQRRASGGSSILSPVWEASPQYNMMTIREVMSLCGSTTSLASTQVS